MTDIYQIALTMINGIGDILARNLLQTLGSPKAIFTEKRRLLEKIPGIGNTLATEIRRPEVLKQAERELEFIEKNNIICYYIGSPNYPKRLKECDDAPILFYFKGKTNLDATRIISVVGTRMATEYGKTLTESLIRDLSSSYPDLLIVSGLAYGIDICAHRNALKYNLPTIGVLAHGLDRIYPSNHRNTAIDMLQCGGLLTDFPSETNPDRPNFVKRNRIVAGLSDATIVIESADKGGSLITADIAFSYGRDIFTFPGRTTDTHSKGCNQLIRENKAGLITSAQDLIQAMCWEKPDDLPPKVIQGELFSEIQITTSNNPVESFLREKKEAHINLIAAELSIPIQQLSSYLFELEMNGIIKVMPGNVYKLIK